MVRAGNKLVYNPNDVFELYYLSNDPWEMRNLADAPIYSGIRLELEAELLHLMHDLNDPLQMLAVNTRAWDVK